MSSKTPIKSKRGRESETSQGADVAPFPAKDLFAEGTVIFHKPDGFEPNTGASCNLPTTEDYTVATYQYGTSTMPNTCQPNYYVRPADGDIKGLQLAVSYAAKNGLAVSVRSGGHQYGGFSSTNGNNIQIDMKLWKNISGFDPKNETFTIGAGVMLKEFDEVLSNLKYRGGAFIAHGMCSWVCVGGHLQTGGYSKDIGRSFGFFIDAVTQYKVLLPPTTPDGTPELVTVTKPTNPKPTGNKPPTGSDFNRNDELWFSMLGGSPGNFGIVTEITIKPHFNDDHPEARTQVRLLPYTKEGFVKLMSICQDYGTREDLPSDYNMSLGTYAGNPSSKDPFINNIDVQMQDKYPEIYGPKLMWLPMPAFIITQTWTNMKGKGQWENDTEAHTFFETVDKACDEIIASLPTAEQLAFKLFMEVNKHKLPQQPVSYKEPTLLSYANTVVLPFAARNQSMPYAASAGIGGMDMAPTYPAWAGEIIDWTLQNSKDDVLGFRHAYVDNGTGMVGGKYSKMSTKNCNNVTALAHRDAGFMVIHYVHWENVVALQNTDKYRQVAMESASKWSAGIAEQCKGDRRWNMFPYQAGPKDPSKPASASNPNQIDYSLDESRQFYFDSEEVYQRVLNAKRTIDPLEVFTPNLFCVGASTQTKHKYDKAQWTQWNYPAGGA